MRAPYYIYVKARNERLLQEKTVEIEEPLVACYSWFQECLVSVVGQRNLIVVIMLHGGCIHQVDAQFGLKTI